MTMPDGGRHPHPTPSAERAAARAATRTRRRDRVRHGRGPQAGPPAAPLPAGVRGRAILDGRRAAWAKHYDEWSFTPDVKIPYLERLRHEREQAIAADRSGAWAGLREIRAALRAARRQDRAGADSTAAELAHAHRWRAIARAREEITLDGLDILAGVHSPRLAFPLGDEEEPGAGEPAATQDDTGPREHDDPDQPGPDAAAFDDQGGAAFEDRAGAAFDDQGGAALQETDEAAAEPGRHPRLRWLGPADGHFAMPIPTPLKLAILALLTVVEIPIYLKIFAYFNARDLTLTWAFTLPVAVGMVLAPHLAGKLYRNRHALPVERAFPYLCAAVMVLWLLGGCLLGWLRQKVLLVPQVDPLTGQRVGNIDRIGVSPWTMTCVFAIILLLSGMIAFVLGVAEAHPAVVAYRAAVRAREDSEAAYLQAVRARAESRDDEMVPEDETLDTYWNQARSRQLALWEEYQAAQLAYLDTVALEMRQPTITQAASLAVSGEEPPSTGRHSPPTGRPGG